MHGCVSRWPPPSARTRTPISHRHHHQHHPDHQQRLQKQKTTPVYTRINTSKSGSRDHIDDYGVMVMVATTATGT